VSSSSVRFSLGRIAALLLVGSVALPGALAAQGTGTVRGKVTETDGGAAVVSAQVVVAGTRLGAVTQPTGEYVITNVPAGPQTIRVMRIGYTPGEKEITVSATAEVRADITIARAATRLAEVVTTATGDQERRSFGNVVATSRRTRSPRKPR
jgi:hypothetical protein